MIKTARDIIVAPIISERSMEGLAAKQYTFKVATWANKIEIRKAVEEIFGVTVDTVNTVSVRAKAKRLSAGRPAGTVPAYKKAIVKLTEDSKTIEFFDSLM